MMTLQFQASAEGGFGFAADMSGYVVRAEFHPRRGLQRGLQICSLTSRSADEALPRATFGASGRHAAGKLALVGQSHSRTFDDISPRRSWTTVSTREKRRYLEFEYDPKRIGADKVKIDNQDDARVEPGGLADDYKYHLKLDQPVGPVADGGREPSPTAGAASQETAEHLLGLTVLQSPQHATVLSLTSLVNRTNSWLQTILEAHGTIKPGRPMAPIILKLSQVGEIRITPQNLDYLVVTEHCGVSVEAHGPSPSDVMAAASTRANPLRWSLPYLGPHELLEHEGMAHSEIEPPDFRAVETATIVFRAGHYNDLCFE